MFILSSNRSKIRIHNCEANSAEAVFSSLFISRKYSHFFILTKLAIYTHLMDRFENNINLNYLLKRKDVRLKIRIIHTVFLRKAQAIKHNLLMFFQIPKGSQINI